MGKELLLKKKKNQRIYASEKATSFLEKVLV